MIYGSRTSADLVLKNLGHEGVMMSYSPFYRYIEEGWPHYVVPSLLMEVNPSPENTIAVTSDPVMINFVPNLEKLNFADDRFILPWRTG